MISGDISYKVQGRRGGERGARGARGRTAVRVSGFSDDRAGVCKNLEENKQAKH